MRIDEDACDRANIRRLRVRDYIPLSLIVRPEDEEIILVSDSDGALPNQLVAEVFDISCQENGCQLQPPQACDARV